MAYVLKKALDLWSRTKLMNEHQLDLNEYAKFSGRHFSNLTPIVIDIITPIIDNELGKGTWEITSGNFFTTNVPYRIHTDTGIPDPRPYKTFVIPLKVFTTPTYDSSKNALYILNQKWDGAASFFVKGTPGVKEEFNKIVDDYAEVCGLVQGFDETLVTECNHLDRSNFEGMSVLNRCEWIPGDIIVFDRKHLHVSTNFLEAGAQSKIGLSIFTSYLERP